MAKTLHYDFKNYPTLDARRGPTLDITRATKATMVDADGYLRTVQSGEARFTGARRVENLCYQSEDFSTGWANVNCVDSVDGTIAPPSGITTVTKLAQATTTGIQQLSRQDSVFANGQSTTKSCYFRAGTASWVFLYTIGRNATDTSPIGIVWFDLANGLVGTEDSATGTITDAGNGWYRCSLSMDTPAWTSSIRQEFRIGLTHADGSQTSTLASGEYLHLAGAQLENVSGAWDSENLLLQSNSFDTTWTNLRSTETSGQSDPDGGANAWSLNSDGTAANTHYIQQAHTVPQAGRYLFSTYVKASNSTWCALQVFNYALSPSNPLVYYNLSTGAKGATDTAIDSGIEDAGGGWYRVWLSFDVLSNDLIGGVRIYVAEGNNDVIFDGNSTEELVIYKAQLERTKPTQTGPGTYTATTTAAVTNYSPSTYIPTTTAAVSSLSGSNDGLLVEEARTNICLQSEDILTTWSEINGASVANQAIAPDGTLSADKLIDNSASGTGAVFIFQSVTVATATVYTYSAYLKADQLNWAALQVVDFTTPVNSIAYFDLSAGVKGTIAAGIDDSGIEDVGNGWYRCWVSFTTDGTDTTGSVRVYPADANNDITVDLDGTSSIFVWGAQLEAGTLTTYISTVAASVTRNADTVSTTDVTWYNTASGSFYAKALRSNTDAANQGRVLCIESSSADYTLIGTFAGTEFDCNINRASTNIASLNAPGVLSDSTAIQAALGYAVNDFAWYVDGIQKELDSAGDPDTGVAVDTLHIGNLGYSIQQYWNGHIAEIAYYDERLDNDTLEDLSNGIFPPEGGSAAGIGLGFGKIGMR